MNCAGNKAGCRSVFLPGCSCHLEPSLIDRPVPGRSEFAALAQEILGPLLNFKAKAANFRLRMHRDEIHLLRDLIRQEIIVCVEILEPLPARESEQAVAS